MSNEEKVFWGLPANKRGNWPEHVQWACSHTTDLVTGKILEEPDGIPVFYDRLRHCFACRTNNNEMWSITNASNLALHITRLSYELLGTLSRSVAKLERAQTHFKTYELGYVEEIESNIAAGKPTFTAPLLKPGDEFWHGELWRRVERITLDVYRGETHLYDDNVRDTLQPLDDYIAWLEMTGLRGEVDDYLKGEAQVNGIKGERYRALVRKFQAQVDADTSFIKWVFKQRSKLSKEARRFTNECYSSATVVFKRRGALADEQSVRNKPNTT